jgi:hypothetical protein
MPTSKLSSGSRCRSAQFRQAFACRRRGRLIISACPSPFLVSARRRARRLGTRRRPFRGRSIRRLQPIENIFGQFVWIKFHSLLGRERRDCASMVVLFGAPEAYLFGISQCVASVEMITGDVAAAFAPARINIRAGIYGQAGNFNLSLISDTPSPSANLP